MIDSAAKAADAAYLAVQTVNRKGEMYRLFVLTPVRCCAVVNPVPPDLTKSLLLSIFEDKFWNSAGYCPR